MKVFFGGGFFSKTVEIRVWLWKIDMSIVSGFDSNTELGGVRNGDRTHDELHNPVNRWTGLDWGQWWKCAGRKKR